MIMIRGAFAVLAIAALAAIDCGPAAAVTYRPWCVQYSGGSGNNGLDEIQRDRIMVQELG